MRIAFDVAGKPVEFRRSCLTGRAELHVDGEVILLQSGWDVNTHLGFHLTTTFQEWIAEHDVKIEMKRPLILAGLRPFHYRVLIDEQLITKRWGY